MRQQPTCRRYVRRHISKLCHKYDKLFNETDCHCIRNCINFGIARPNFKSDYFLSELRWAAEPISYSHSNSYQSLYVEHMHANQQKIYPFRSLNYRNLFMYLHFWLCSKPFQAKHGLPPDGRATEITDRSFFFYAGCGARHQILHYHLRYILWHAFFISLFQWIDILSPLFLCSSQIFFLFLAAGNILVFFSIWLVNWFLRSRGKKLDIVI